MISGYMNRIGERASLRLFLEIRFAHIAFAPSDYGQRHEGTACGFPCCVPFDLMPPMLALRSPFPDTVHITRNHKWIHAEPEHPQQEAFIYDFGLYEPYRGKGYAKQALVALDQTARSMGIPMLRAV